MIRIQRLLRLNNAVAVAVTAALLAACSTPGPMQSSTTPGVIPDFTPSGAEVTPQMAAAAELLTRMAAQQDRLYRIAAPLLINNAELCTKHARNLLGFSAKNRYAYPGQYNEAAHLVLGMGERLQVTNVLAGSGAARAGLQTGDVLLAAGGKPLPTGEHALSQAGAIFNGIIKTQPSLPMTIERRGNDRQITIPVTRVCAFAIELGNADNVNAYGDGSRVLVTRGMIGVARNDDELAFVLAKTMAHNMLGHAGAQRNQATIGSIIDNLKSVTPDTSLLIGSGGIKAMPAEMDAAADRLGIYLAARAGYDVEDAPAFWKRLADQVPPTVLNGYSANHPALPARLAAVEKAVAEVKAKRSAKKPLVP